MAQGVPRPDGLPPGPLRDLVHALHDLYRDAGMPSMRTISNAIRRRNDLPDTVSHETVSQMLRGESVPGWAKFECVVRHLAGVAVHRPNVSGEVTRFHQLWLATVANAATTTAPAPAPATTVPSGAVATTVAPVAVHVGEVPPRNIRFIGREHLVRTIHEILRTGVPLLTLTGIGGVGKTQLAIEYVHRFRDHYDLVWWIPSEYPSQLRASIAELGARLKLPGSEDMQHPPAQVMDALGHSALRWLLVFDDVESLDSLPPLPVPKAGHVLATSRDPDWEQHGSQLEIGVFERGESIRLLRDRANLEEADADRIAERLGDLPLAVEQVAWHLATGVQVATYLDDLDQQMHAILSDDRNKVAHYPATVPGFLNVAFSRLADAAPAAAQLLELFAWLSAEPLSLALLRSGRHGAVTSPLRETLRHAPTLNSAVRDLRRYGLATVVEADPDGNPMRIQVHRVFQGVLKLWLGKTRLDRGRANVHAILAAANPAEPDAPRFWGHYAEVGPHVTAADLITAEDFEVRRVALDQARYLYRVGHYAESRALAERLVAATMRDGSSEPDHHFYVLARYHLANALRTLGDYTAARQATLEGLTYLENHPEFGPQVEYIAHLERSRAVDLRISGAYANALTVDEASYGRQRREDADDQDKLRVLRNNIAVSLRLLGRFADAYDIDTEIARQWADTHGARDPRTLLARSNLARDMFGLGRYADALSEVRAVLPAYRAVVGAKHHGVLLAVRTEVMALRKLGELENALRLAEENRRDFETWFGPSHEYTLAAGISLVNARLAVGDLGTASVEMPELLGGCERLFGADHPMTLAVLVNSASVSRALGDLHGARRRDEQAAAELSRVLGDDHPYTLCAHHNLAVDLARLGDVRRAVDVAEAVLARSRATRGPTHPDTLACAVNITLARGERVDHTSPPAPAGDALEAWSNLLGAAHPQVLAARAGRSIECDIEPPPT
ncbi:MAG TPA: FxSxx-COOH system tetratricopeptide repeat protein [Actinophytocola sp.]|uniref:FxSxx-COOH system tetratricopeptide repeat protein n=1 Tax=Actinophytocola sp. TaxID=1872138 RepID=UPI002DDCA9A3|nr:FxSxx-COOH system tetratricopeptide repeat protein [Actinophytocola sp.]HEV2779001.1 FxSxx-COOH system tetratricopeptide repeat protein [Actinophytocola sp.]